MESLRASVNAMPEPVGHNGCWASWKIGDLGLAEEIHGQIWVVLFDLRFDWCFNLLDSYLLSI